MPGSCTWAFSEAEDFEIALREEGNRAIVVSGPGEFEARLTRVTLNHLSLVAANERLSRIAFVAVPADMVLISLQIGNGSRQIWGDIEAQAGEIVALGPCGRGHARTEGPCRWGSIRLPILEFARYSHALLGKELVLAPFATRWRGPPAARKQLAQLHAAAIRTAIARPATLTESVATHGLEQQVIEALVACLQVAPMGSNAPATRQNQDLAARFEELLRSGPDASLPIPHICAALGVSPMVLRRCCEQQLGIGPTHYRRLRQLQFVRRALLSGAVEPGGLAATAQRYGVHDLSRFTTAYRTFFSELPSATLRRALDLSQ
jgi:methylphosphotriester-DNA--protein-cysteine methyltransferase